MRNFNNIFRKDTAYDKFKSYKKAGYHNLFPENTISEKSEKEWEGGIDPFPLTTVKRHSYKFDDISKSVHCTPPQNKGILA